ncbi:putative oxoglutarate iron-dependent oxygenase [Golovinomyces cichoracearum]|uniref:Putative oxoglutarate iron-dependent oxygenase n=1 Tax=Golovinomyces cichoracearum TaxID=62708 RepID=A0A420IB61_9PEZI|nr:putative oxoglutarate iron-dependent oxygenase [Golovinomyces cichoracearum]
MKQKKIGSDGTDSNQTKPNWPILKPLLPSSSLSLQTLLPSQIVVVKNFWTEDLCKKYVTFLKTLPLTTTGRPKKGEALRVNDRFQINDDSFAHRLWEETGLRELICGFNDPANETEMISKGLDQRELWGGEVVGLNPSIRIYRYKKGQFFGQHYDESNLVYLNRNHQSTHAITTWTVLLYLTSPASGCQGGETVFYNKTETNPRIRREPSNKLVVNLETGMLLLHKHGDECLLHEGREVLQGEKWVIRTDICVSKKK